MLITLQEASALIESGKWLHISGSAELLKQLPKGNWIGGSIEYFMDKSGGIVTDQKVFVDQIPYSPCKVTIYDAETIEQITKDTYDNGFSIVILPFGSEVRNTYSLKAPEIEDLLMKNVVGWVSGVNLSVPGQSPITINGQTGEFYGDKAVVLHVSLPPELTANIGIVNIFEPDENSPTIEFTSTSSTIEKCLVDGKEVVLMEYITENNIDTKVPLLGEYFGADINMSIFSVDNNVITFAAPSFEGIKYRFGKRIDDYPKAFLDALAPFKGETAIFSCNCAYNFLYGELDGKKLDCFFGPMSFGEIAYQLMNQTLVYLTVS